jgi:hypothetical protein
MRKYTHLSLVALMLLLCACGSSTIVVESYDPIRNAGSEKIGVVPFTCVVVGQVGHHHDGVLALEQNAWVLGSSLTAAFPTQITSLLSAELTNAGYNAMNIGTTVLTSGVEESLTRAIGGSVTALTVDTYSPLCGNKANCTIEIRFDITDVTTGEVLISQTYNGSGVAEGVYDPVAGIQMAAQNAIRHMLSDKAIANILGGS